MLREWFRSSDRIGEHKTNASRRRSSFVRVRPSSAVQSIVEQHSVRRVEEWSSATARDSWSGRRSLWSFPNVLWRSYREEVWRCCQCRRTCESPLEPRVRDRDARWDVEVCIALLRSAHRCLRCSSSVSAWVFARRSTWPADSCSFDCQRWGYWECPRHRVRIDDRRWEECRPIVESTNRYLARNTELVRSLRRKQVFTIRVAWSEMFLRAIRQLCRMRILFVVRICFSKILKAFNCRKTRLIVSFVDEMIGNNFEIVKRSLSYLVVSKMNNRRWTHSSLACMNVFELLL